MKYVKRAKSVKKKQASVPKSAESEGTALYNRDSDASTGSDNDLGVMDNSMIVDSDSEKGVQVENYDTEFEQHTYVSFVPGKFGKIYPEENKYNVVTSDMAYIGRFLKVRKTSVIIKFLERRMKNQYNCPKRDDIDEINMIHLISEPVVFSGTPFNFRGIDKAFTDFKMHVKQNMM